MRRLAMPRAEVLISRQGFTPARQAWATTAELPAPLLAAAGRGREVARTPDAVRRITAVTIAFTVGHSATLVLGTLGLPVPQQPVEAAIAVSILVAAVHARCSRDANPSSRVLSALCTVWPSPPPCPRSTCPAATRTQPARLQPGHRDHAAGVVLLVLPPLVVLARTPYRPLRTAAAVVTAVAAVGWLLDRAGIPTSSTLPPTV